MAEARRIKVVGKEDNIGERDPEALREKGKSVMSFSVVY